MEEIREKAENYLSENPSSSVSMRSESDNLKLIHELEINEIEFAIQNDILVESNLRSIEEARKYSELYDFSPMGYFTLSTVGEIIELNLQGSKLLNKQQSDVINSLFGFFVDDEDKKVYNLFLEKIFLGAEKETCVIKLSLEDNFTKHVILSGKITADGENCMIAAIDNTELIESELKMEITYNSIVYRELKMVELKEEINGLLMKAGEKIRY